MRVPLDIAAVEIVPVRPRNGLVAFASCIINGQLFLGGIGIHSRLKGQGFRLVFPAKVLPNGKKIEFFHPINRHAGEVLENTIGEKYESLVIPRQIYEYGNESCGDNIENGKFMP